MLIHQASAGFQGTASDIEVQAREILRMNARLKEMMAADTGQSVERVGRDINRDYWMSAAEARDYGMIDRSSARPTPPPPPIEPRPRLPTPPQVTLDLPTARPRRGPVPELANPVTKVAPQRVRDRIYSEQAGRIRSVS